MDPAAIASVRALAQMLQLRPGAPAPEVEALMKAVGQELALRFLGQVAEGAQLEMPNGRVLTATGEIPYPPGTELRVKVALEGGEKGGALRLQTLEAKPPTPPALLAPLVQSEAAPLQQQLQQPAPLSELAPLVQLLKVLAEAPEAPLPTPQRVLKELQALPPDLARSLALVLEADPELPLPMLAQRLLAAPEQPQAEPMLRAEKAANPAMPEGLAPPAPTRPADVLARLEAQLLKAGLPPEARPALEPVLKQVLAQLFPELAPPREAAAAPALPVPEAVARELAALPRDLLRQLAAALGAEPEAPPALLAQRLLALKAVPKPEAPAASAPELLTRLQRLLAHADIPKAPKAAVETWARQLLTRPPEAKPEAKLDAPLAGSRILPRAELAKALLAHGKAQGPAIQVPEVWEAWVKGSVRALADPELSPREAPFHAVQAKEATGYFEIPLPWSASRTLQLWVEEDAPEARPPGGDKTTRLLLGLSFSRLGETRIGLQRCGEALAARVWCEHPDLLSAQAEGIEHELRELAATVDLRILPLAPGPDGGIPDLRSLVRGSSLHALG